MRLLILTAGFGEGHNAAARALSLVHEARHGPGSAPVVDVLARAAPGFNGIARRGYIGLINGAPNAWRFVYAWLDRSRLVPFCLGRMRAERRVLRSLLARERPAAIGCTFPGYAFLLAAMARAGELTVPFFNVVTDSISLNSLWWRAGAAGWFVPNAESADVMRHAGVDPNRLYVSGFPVQPFFAEHEGRLRPPDLAEGVTPRVLYIVNSGRRYAAETAERLLRETDWEITCTVGRDQGLQTRLERLAASRRAPALILGWTNEIPRLLMTHHVVVSKAGGATTQEALAARCPMIVNQIVSGQEEGNYELLRRHGVGAFAATPDATVAALRVAFAQQGQTWRNWRAALDPLCRPRAAQEILRRVETELAADLGAEPIPLPLRPASMPV